MKETPILMCAEMVRAVLTGRKSQTRRSVRLPTWSTGDWKDFELEARTGTPVAICANTGCFGDIVSPYGQSGDRLWVRETHYWDRYDKLPNEKPKDFPIDFYYRADGECCQQIPECQCGFEGKPKWRPSIFMPRWASRLTLEIVSGRVERVHQITYRDVLAEGITEQQIDHWRKWLHKDDAPAHTFGVLWDSLNANRDDGKYAWAKNPFVWVITFRRIEPISDADMEKIKNTPEEVFRKLPLKSI